jgi:hypothetical protein
MAWEMGSMFLGLGIAIFSLVASMLGLTIPRGLLVGLLGASILLMLVWPVSSTMAWLQNHYKIERTTGLFVFSVIGAILGALVFGRIWLSTPSQTPAQPISPTAEQIAQELKGGNSFCYFSVYTSNLKNLKGPFELSLTATGNLHGMWYWPYLASTKPTNDRSDPYWSLKAYQQPPVDVPEGTVLSGMALPLGEYKFDFVAANGKWFEELKFYILNGEMKQNIKVTDAKGRVIFELKDTDTPK